MQLDPFELVRLMKKNLPPDIDQEEIVMGLLTYLVIYYGRNFPHPIRRAQIERFNELLFTWGMGYPDND